MSGQGDWGVQSSSVTLPPFAGPNDASIVIGDDLPQCMQANYVSAIFFRPVDSQAPISAPIYFIAQRRTFVGAAYINVVDHGWVVDNGVMCGYVVQKRVGGSNQNGLGTNFVMTERTAPNIEISGLTMLSTQVQWDGVQDMFLMSTNTRFFAYGDQLSLRNDTRNGAANANGNTASAAYANYPTNVQPSITKVGGAGSTELEVHYSQTYHVDNTLTGINCAVLINGTDWKTHQVPGGSVNPGVRVSSMGMVKTTGGTLAAGTYTITPRWARLGGVGNVLCSINDDWSSVSVREVPA